MAIFTNSAKDSSSFSNQAHGANANASFATDNFSWANANGTFGDPRDGWTPNTKNTTTPTNQVKN